MPNKEFPNHGVVETYFAKHPDELRLIVKKETWKIHNDELNEYLKNNKGQEIEGERKGILRIIDFESGDKESGFWDFIFDFHIATRDVSDPNRLWHINDSTDRYYVEYKTTTKEMNIDEILRQIKCRRGNLSKDHPYTIILLSFDTDFLHYEELFKHQRIELVVLQKETKVKIMREFGLYGGQNKLVTE